MAASGTRAAYASVLAVLALIAVFCVVEEANVTHEAADGKNELIGNDRLIAKKNALRAIQKAKTKGHDMDSVDDMLHGFQSEPRITSDTEFAESLKSAYQPPSELAQAFSPEALGLVKRDSNGKLQFPDMNLLQEDDYAEWTPTGSPDLLTQIKDAQTKNEADEDAEIYSAMGMTAPPQRQEDNNMPVLEAKELLFVQMPEWTPKGQKGFAEEIKAAHDSDDEEDNDDFVAVDSIKTTSHGVTQGEYESPELSFVQDGDATAAWKPSGQSGLAGTITHIKAVEQQSEDEEDGMVGNTLLSQAGMGKYETDAIAPESSLLQTEAAEWKPKPMHMPAHVKTSPPLTLEDAKELAEEIDQKKYASHEHDDEPMEDIFAIAGLTKLKAHNLMADSSQINLDIKDLLN